MEEKTKQVLIEENDALRKEVASLKKKIGGYITANNKYKERLRNATMKCEEATRELLVCKGNIKEATLECEKCLVEHKEEVRLLKKEVNQLEQTLIDKNTKYEETLESCEFYKGKYEYNMSLPWYKRIFMK